MLFNIRKHTRQICITNVIKNIFKLNFKIIFPLNTFSYFYLNGINSTNIAIYKN